MKTRRWGILAVAPLATVWSVGCAGMYTRVPLPSVSSQEERAVEGATPAMGTQQLEDLMRRSYYAIAYEEAGGTDGRARADFVSTSIAREPLSPVRLVALAPKVLAEVADREGPSASMMLSEAVAKAQAPLRRRLERIGRNVSRAAGRSDIVFVLDPTQGLNAGAPSGFATRTVLVGPQMLLLAETEDALALLLGHEVAHITQEHTRTLAVQNALVTTLQIAGAVAIAVVNVAACQRGGHCATGDELRNSAAAAATLTGVVVNGTLTAAGFGRDEEREADYYGLQYAKGAGYRPEEAAVFFRRLLAYEKGTRGAFEIPFLRDHPATAERVVRLEKWSAAPPADGPSVVASVDRKIVPDSPPSKSVSKPAESSVSTRMSPTTMDLDRVVMAEKASGCWKVPNAAGALCSTCCSGGRCQTECSDNLARNAGDEVPAQVRTCWNVDGHEGDEPAVCTTCCTAVVTCSTVCTRVAAQER